MLGESIFTIHQFKIPVHSLNVPIYLIPFGDIHRFAHLCDKEKWAEFLEWARHKKDAYFLGMGDYDDLASFSERRALMEATLHDETRLTLDEIYTSRVKQMVQELKFMEGRIIGLLEGNHYGVLQSGMTTTQMMCDKLHCKYLGVSSFIRLSFGYADKRYAIDVWAHHGKGASRLVGGSLNTVQQMADVADAQIYLMGHDHKKSTALKTRLVLTHGGSAVTLSHRKILLARTGSFLKGYVENCPSYVANAGLPPTDMGVVKIELTPKRDQKNGRDEFYIDIHASI
jgi:hypothetical protein